MKTVKKPLITLIVLFFGAIQGHAYNLNRCLSDIQSGSLQTVDSFKEIAGQVGSAIKNNPKAIVKVTGRLATYSIPVFGNVALANDLRKVSTATAEYIANHREEIALFIQSFDEMVGDFYQDWDEKSDEEKLSLVCDVIIGQIIVPEVVILVATLGTGTAVSKAAMLTRAAAKSRTSMALHLSKAPRSSRGLLKRVHNQINTGRAVSQSHLTKLAQQAKKAQPASFSRYVKPKKTVAVKIDDIDSVDELEKLVGSDVARKINKVDSNVDDGLLAIDDDYVRSGDYLIIQYRADGSPDFYIPPRNDTHYDVFDDIADAANATRASDDMTKAGVADRMVAVRSPEVEMVRASDLGIPVDSEVRLMTNSGEKVKEAGEDVFIALGKDKDGNPISWMVKMEPENGLPIGFKVTAESVKARAVARNAYWSLDDGRKVFLLTPDEVRALPDGTVLHAIDGTSVIKSADNVEELVSDTRRGLTAFGFI